MSVMSQCGETTVLGHGDNILFQVFILVNQRSPDSCNELRRLIHNCDCSQFRVFAAEACFNWPISLESVHTHTHIINAHTSTSSKHAHTHMHAQRYHIKK